MIEYDDNYEYKNTCLKSIMEEAEELTKNVKPYKAQEFESDFLQYAYNKRMEEEELYYNKKDSAYCDNLDRILNADAKDLTLDELYARRQNTYRDIDFLNTLQQEYFDTLKELQEHLMTNVDTIEKLDAYIYRMQQGLIDGVDDE